VRGLEWGGQGAGQREPQRADCGLVEIGFGQWTDTGCIYITIV